MVATSSVEDGRVTFKQGSLLPVKPSRYGKDVIWNIPTADLWDPQVQAFPARLAILRDRLFQWRVHEATPPMEVLRQDWEGSDCKVSVNDPELFLDEIQVFESTFEWLSQVKSMADEPQDDEATCMPAVVPHPQAEDSDGEEKNDHP